MKLHPVSIAARRQERGVVLFVALIVLIVMTLAGLALLRQLSAGSSIAGNIAFKENATYVADRGAEVAIQYLRPPFPTPPNDLAADAFALGYASSWTDGDDVTAYPWGQNTRTFALPDVPLLIEDILKTNNTAEVFIQRLCRDANKSSLDPSQLCSDKLIDNPFRTRGGLGSVAPMSTKTPSPYYRVTTRVVGPRGTMTYTQVMVQ